MPEDLNVVVLFATASHFRERNEWLLFVGFYLSKLQSLELRDRIGNIWVVNCTDNPFSKPKMEIPPTFKTNA